MTRDERYQHVKSIWKAGDLKSFYMIFRIVPKSIVCEDLGQNYGRFAKKLGDLRYMDFGDILEISRLIDVDFKVVVEMVADEIREMERIRKTIGKKSPEMQSGPA